MSVNGRQSAAQVSGLAWALASVGLIAGVLVLGLFGLTLSRVTVLRARASEVQVVARDVLDAFDADRTRLAWHIVNLLAERDTAAPTFRGMDSFRDQFQRRTSVPGGEAVDQVLSTCSPLRAGAARLEQLLRETNAWCQNNTLIQTGVADARARADAALAALRGAADTAEGRQRLAYLTARRRLQNSADPAGAARALLALGDDAQVSAIKAELADLALLRDELIFGSDLDRLSDLKDNRFAPALTRLRSMLARHAAETAGADALGPALLTTLETVLFGEKYAFDAEHQTITLGTGGLFELLRRQIESRLVNAELGHRTAMAATDLRALRASIGVKTGAITDDLSRRAQDMLLAQWGLMLAVGAAAAGVFVVLARRIASRLRRIVAHLEEANASLGRARTAAEEASRVKGEFLANMSHEIRTPMTAILGYADLLLDPNQTPSDRADCIAVVRRNGEHLLSLINDILDLSKIEAGKMTVESIDCAPVQVVHEVLSLMQVRAAAKSLELCAECDPALPAMVRSDPIRLRQILVNLVGNAIKFTERGRVVVAARYEPGAPGGPRLRFDITDSGIGLTQDELGRLFSPFCQADTSITRKHGGTGLGLTISRRLAQLLGGDVSASSTPGQGSCFTVTITVALAGAAVNPGSATVYAVAAPAPANPAPLAGLRILLAEDGPDNQRLIGFHLRKAGATVDIAENGRVAAVMAYPRPGAAAPYHIILMDMQMPELDGYSAASLLRQRGCPTPIIALTAHAMAEDRQRCLAAGCDDYQTKPINRETLIAVCGEWAKRTPARAA